jgi:hypothetical protein
MVLPLVQGCCGQLIQSILITAVAPAIMMHGVDPFALSLFWPTRVLFCRLGPRLGLGVDRWSSSLPQSPAKLPRVIFGLSAKGRS